MNKTELIANKIINDIGNGISIDKIKQAFTKDEWYRYSSKAYQIHFKNHIKEREIFLKKPHTIGTTSKQIDQILDANNALADYALCMNIFSTVSDLNQIQKLIPLLPHSEPQLIKIIGSITMHPKMRMLQKKGRIEKFPHFNIFTKTIDAALISYYRTNFISCYLTLLPIIEGIIIRWMGYSETDIKPDFEEIRKFFKIFQQRQPCPYNTVFHNVYSKACDKILNQHFYKPTGTGDSYANFNRHVASHILNDNQFATKENCIRLFILIDAMTEVYLYESRKEDPRFSLHNEVIENEIKLLTDLMLSNLNLTPEHIFLGTSIKDIP